jgi:hypothetical protein
MRAERVRLSRHAELVKAMRSGRNAFAMFRQSRALSKAQARISSSFRWYRSSCNPWPRFGAATRGRFNPPS